MALTLAEMVMGSTTDWFPSGVDTQIEMGISPLARVVADTLSSVVTPFVKTTILIGSDRVNLALLMRTRTVRSWSESLRIWMRIAPVRLESVTDFGVVTVIALRFARIVVRKEVM